MNKNNIKNHVLYRELANNSNLKLRILYLIKKFGPITKQELSNILGINLNTINNLVNYINNNYKLILEINNKKITGGRRAHLYAINSKAAFTIGVDVGGENFRVILTDLEGNIIKAVKEKTVQKKDPKFLLEKILNNIKNIIVSSNISIKEILGGGGMCFSLST